MIQKKIWLSPPHLESEEEEFVKDALSSNWVAPLGAYIDGFESDLELFLKNDSHVSALSSGTAALHLALVLLGISKGDEVLCQTFTFCASVNPVKYVGATPVFIDSDPINWNLCPNQLEIAIKDRIKKFKKPKAIILVHIYGMPARMNEIVTISKKYDIPIIEDSAEALGSTFKSIPCGTFGKYGIFSFNGNKIITTSSGGALISKTKLEKEKAIFYATQAKDRANHYHHSEIGFNYRMSNILAAIGRAQIIKLKKRLKQRRGNHEFYKKLFKHSKNINIFSEENKLFVSNHWLNCVTIKKGMDFTKNEIIDELAKANIEARQLWKPMHMQPLYCGNLFFGSNVAENIFNNGLCLPSGSNLTKADRHRINKTLKPFI